MLIQVGTGKTYTDVLGKLGKEANLDTSHTKGVRARLTKLGDLITIRRSFNEIFEDEVTRRFIGRALRVEKDESGLEGLPTRSSETQLLG